MYIPNSSNWTPGDPCPRQTQPAPTCTQSGGEGWEGNLANGRERRFDGRDAIEHLSPTTVDPEGSKVPKYGAAMVSTLGIITMVLGRCLMFGYLDP